MREPGDTSPNPYLDKLKSIGFSASCTPTRGGNSEVVQTLIREKRWHRDIKSFRNLKSEGLNPPQIDGSALRERQGESRFDVEQRRVTIDYNDPT